MTISTDARDLFSPAPATAGASLLDGLNAEQLQAVTLPPGPALILAGAGSGKTRVLTTRIAWLIQTGQVSPAGVMAVTFTNKAAREMLTRLSAMLPINTRGMWVGTFHGLCNRFLRAHHKLADLPAAFQILDTQDQLSAVKRVIRALNIDEERCVPKQAAWFISASKEDGLRPKDIVPHDELSRLQLRVYEAYEDQCRREGVADFAELMLRVYELLRDHTELREHYQRRFRHLLVDEFQDTNRLQYAWLKLFAGVHGSVFAVGDDDQSIYAFRGAQVGNMADFEREFRIQHVIKLEQNYRSVGHILEAANTLIARNTRRLGKNLRTDAGPGQPIRVFEATSDFAEAQWLVEEIGLLHREGLARQDAAVLYRSNAQSRVLETALFNAGVPYRVYGGLRFFERAEIKHALAYLRLLENPNDDTSFLRVVNFPARGIGARTLEQLQDAARHSGRSLSQSVGAVTGRAAPPLAAFVALLDAMREATRGMTLREIIEHVVDASGLETFYRGEKEGQDRLENLAELVNAAESFVTQQGFGKDVIALPLDEQVGVLAGDGTAAPVTPYPDQDTGEIVSPLAAFLAHAALEAGDNQAQAGQDAVQLMTIHSAKGLEFDAVFITGLEEGLFPHENALSDPDGLEEERRLMYVAITRARQRLYLSFSQTRMLHGQTRYNVKSRFFEELPESAMKWLTPRHAGFAQPSRVWGRPGGAVPELPAALTRRDGGAETAGLRVGQGVFHNKFGEGVVVTLEGGGADARAQINFGRHGMKWLALSVAKLTPIS